MRVQAFILSLSFVFAFQVCVAYFNNINIHLKKRFFKQKNSNIIKMKTCYPLDDDNEDDFNNRKNKNVLFNENNTDIYTLIWYDCPKCKELLESMKELKLQHNYINGGYYFFDITDEKSEFNSPLFYKDDKLIGDTLFDIYSEIYNIV